MSDHSNTPETREEDRRDALHIPHRLSFAQRAVEGLKQGVLIAVLVVGGLMGFNAIHGESAATRRIDQNSAISRAGVEGIACMLRLPPAGSPGGRTQKDVDKCLAHFTTLVENRD